MNCLFRFSPWWMNAGIDPLTVMEKRSSRDCSGCCWRRRRRADGKEKSQLDWPRQLYVGDARSFLFGVSDCGCNPEIFCRDDDCRCGAFIARACALCFLCAAARGMRVVVPAGFERMNRARVNSRKLCNRERCPQYQERCDDADQAVSHRRKR